MIEQFLTDMFYPQFYVEILLVVFSVVFAFLSKKLIEIFLAKKAENRSQYFIDHVYNVLSPAFRPIITLVTLITLDFIFRSWIGENRTFIALAYEFIFLWGFIRLIQFSTHSKTVIVICGLLGLSLILVDFTGNLEALVAYLDRYSFSLGKYKFSIVKLIKAIFALAILMWVASVSIRLIRFIINQFTRLKLSNRELTIKGAQIIIYFMLFMVALDVIGIDLTALAVLGGAIGVGLGFGLQRIIANFISGLVLLMEKTVEVNDVVEMENGLYGYVRHIGGRYTMVETLDGREILVPNEEFITTKVTNWTYTNQTGRMVLDIGVSLKTENLEEVSAMMLNALKDHPRILKVPAPRCLLDEFSDSAIKFKLQFWLDDVSYNYWQVKSDVMMAIWRLFREHGIEFPHAQRDLHLTSIDENVLGMLSSVSQKATPKTTLKKTTQKAKAKGD